MAYVITDACKGTKAAECVAACPMDCIHPTPDGEGFDEVEQLYIDPGVCIDCNMCANECPVHAIYQEDDLPQGKQHFAQINADWFK